MWAFVKALIIPYLHSVHCLCQANMLLLIFLLSLVLPSFTKAGADAQSSPKQGLEGLEFLVEKLLDMATKMQGEKEKLELRLEEVEMKMSDEKEKQANKKKELEAIAKEMEMRLEAKNKEMETRLEELEGKMKEEKDELEKRERGLEASVSKLRMEVEGSLKKEIASNFSNSNALTHPSLRDLPIILFSAWRDSPITYPQTVTFDSFLANYNNAARPGGGDGVLDLDSGVFTCLTPGYYTVSFSAEGTVRSGFDPIHLYLFKNGSTILPESRWYFGNSAANGIIQMIGSRIVVSE